MPAAMKCLLAFFCGSALLTASGTSESTSTTATGAFLATSATTTTAVATTEWEDTQSVESGSKRRGDEGVEAPSDHLHASENVTNFIGLSSRSKDVEFCDGWGPFTDCPMNHGKKFHLCVCTDCWRGCCCGCLFGGCELWNPHNNKLKGIGCWTSATQDRCVVG